MFACYNSPGVGCHRGVNGRGVGDWSFQDIYSWVTTNAQSGSQTAGSISTFLANLGYSVESIRNTLNGIANTVGGDPVAISAAQQELLLLNNGYIPTQNKTNWVPIVLVGGLIALMVLKSDRR